MVAIIFAVLFLCLYSSYAPYWDDSDDLAQTTGQFMIFCDMFSSLVIRANLLGTTLAAKNVVDSFLVISTASLALVQLFSPFTDSFMNFFVPISTKVFRFLSILCTFAAIDEEAVEKTGDAACEVEKSKGADFKSFIKSFDSAPGIDSDGDDSPRESLVFGHDHFKRESEITFRNPMI